MLLVYLLLLLNIPPVSPDSSETLMVYKVNQVRTAGCRCGGKKMPPVKEVEWNDKLFQSALAHATDMRKYRYFSHFSRKGEDVGKRVDKVDYNWQVIGENIAEGQTDFEEALSDWIKSPSHCRMIMDPKVNEMGVARSGKYWVQHFGKRKTRRY